MSQEKEFYKYTYQELILVLGEEEAKKKAEWYKVLIIKEPYYKQGSLKVMFKATNLIA